MAYASLADLIAAFGESEVSQLSDRDQPASGSIDGGVVGRALAAASAEIDGYLANRYQVPLAPVPALIVGIACDLARYALYTDAVPDVVASRQKNAVRLLQEIGAGRMSLGVATLPPVADTGNPVAVRAPSRVFGSDLGY